MTNGYPRVKPRVSFFTVRFNVWVRSSGRGGYEHNRKEKLKVKKKIKIILQKK
jgi:hypothetical protein